ncbi:tetratricopeptide repeat protein [Streptomyces sp. NBC_00356]|uniref:tetratricopeptide repeat protein n=1 Tax=Streptomyces sp. NBC_00356 TaxID=2975724 RepID=UPI002E25814A
MRECNRPECGEGTINEHGFCTVCALEPLPREPMGPPTVAPPPRVGVRRVRPDPWYGLALVDDPQLHRGATTTRPTDAGTLNESHRFCANPGCGKPVGRGRDGQAGLTAGFCAYCGTRFDFTQIEGLVIADRYEVRQLLGQGSYGAAYLAYDRRLGIQVVVKQLRTSKSKWERDVLVDLRHDAIVRILGHEVEGEGEHRRSYLVLEYVPGSALSARPGDALADLLAHGLRILQALDYLHHRGLLHCDVKPLNIIRFQETTTARVQKNAPDLARDRVRLIDFGAVRTTDDTSPFVEYTPTYAPGPDDAEYTIGPTPGFDLYGLGESLRELCRAHLATPSAPGVQALTLLLQRATHDGGPDRRFTSARQFGEQLSGVLRQVAAASSAPRPVQRASALFGPVDPTLHGGLGAARPLAHWTGAVPLPHWTDRAPARPEPTDPPPAPHEIRALLLPLPPPFSTPGAAAIAAALPKPVRDPDDRLVTEDVHHQLALCRSKLGAGEVEECAQELKNIPLPAGHWMRAWYAALLALTHNQVKEAIARFKDVRAALPGELVPHLALGLCFELDRNPSSARARYTTAFDTAPALGAAGFGLARVLHRTGETEAAARVVETLTHELPSEQEARIAQFRLGVARYEAGLDSGARLREQLTALDVDEADHANLAAELAHAQFVREGARLALSREVRTLARHAIGDQQARTLVDLANHLRPPPRWPWSPRRRTRATEPGHRNDNALRLSSSGQ